MKQGNKDTIRFTVFEEEINSTTTNYLLDADTILRYRVLSDCEDNQVDIIRRQFQEAAARLKLVQSESPEFLEKYILWLKEESSSFLPFSLVGRMGSFFIGIRSHNDMSEVGVYILQKNCFVQVWALDKDAQCGLEIDEYKMAEEEAKRLEIMLKETPKGIISVLLSRARKYNYSVLRSEAELNVDLIGSHPSLLDQNHVVNLVKKRFSN